MFRPSIIRILIPILIGSLAFAIMGGLRVLNISITDWISLGDPTQHFLGWGFFRKSPWTIPFGINPEFGAMISSSIVYSDSIPLFAIPFKLIGPLISGDFQYFGVWYLCCFILQAFFSWLLIGLITSDTYLKATGTIFFTTAPSMLSLIGITAALSAHFLILAALFLYFRSTNTHRILYWTLLIVASALIHFYLFFMVMLIWLSDIFDRSTGRIMPSTRLIIQEILCIIFFLAIFTWLAGYYVVVSQSLPASGYGDVTKKLNIAAIFFDQTWSIALSYLPQLVSPLASNNFLGMGIILGLIFIALLIISKKHGPSIAVKKRRGLIFCMFICVFIAMTNNIHIGNLHLYIPLPEVVLNVLGVVRGSTRFFWPAYYLIIYIFLFTIIKQFSTKHSRIILTLLLCIQLFDISHGFLSKRNSVFLNSAPSFDSPLQDPFWKKAGVIYNSLYLVPELPERTSFEIFGTFALRNNMKTNSALIARVDLAKVASSNQVFDHAVTSGSYEPRSLYVIDDDLVLAVSKNLNSERDLFARIDGFNVVAPGWLSCADCPVVSPQSVIKRATPPPAKTGSEILFGKGDLGTSYLYGVGQFERIGWGWAYPEKWGTWSEGRQAKLFIPYAENVKPKSLTLTMKALISKTQSSQRVEIWINNQLQQTATLNKSDGNVVFISLPISARNFALIDFHFPDAISPQELGIGNDTRKLAIGLESAVLRD